MKRGNIRGRVVEAGPIDAAGISLRLGIKFFPGRRVPLLDNGVMWNFDELNAQTDGRRIIVSVDTTSGRRPLGGDVDWLHASISRRFKMPTYDDLKVLHAAVFVDGWAYQVFAPPADHINIHSRALHLWGRIDGQPMLPDFVVDGEI